MTIDFDSELEEREKLFKDFLRQARLFLCKAQEIIRPTDERYDILMDIMDPIEEMIIKQ